MLPFFITNQMSSTSAVVWITVVSVKLMNTAVINGKTSVWNSIFYTGYTLIYFFIFNVLLLYMFPEKFQWGSNNMILHYY